ncbi:hypothetical protein [Staphylococcus arlettae]|uniref:hypothetical protein n=1 Tax=Staphylococcus arlettae TaxID=29378 RepID=UPI001056E4D8|nr:hypothetical protein [Staphylococcus arlettae]
MGRRNHFFKIRFLSHSLFYILKATIELVNLEVLSRLLKGTIFNLTALSPLKSEFLGLCV